MHPETPRMNLSGFATMTTIMALCSRPTHLGGGHSLK